MMKKSVALLATLVMFVGTDISVAAPKVHLRMATTVSSPHVWYLGAEYFAKRVAELSNNEIEVSIHGGGSVGNENAIANGLRLGSLDMMILSFTPLASLVPEGAVFCIPYIFTGYDHNARVMKTGSPVFNLMQKYVERRNVGFKVLATAGGGARCYLNTLRPIVTPEDMKDMKIRTVTNSMTKKIWELLAPYLWLFPRQKHTLPCKQECAMLSKLHWLCLIPHAYARLPNICRCRAMSLLLRIFLSAI